MIPRGSDDLLARQALIEEHTRRELSVLNIVKAIGTDALFALHAVAHRMDQELGATYGQRVQAFYRHCRDRDLTMAVAQTDVKGDRSRLPHEQDDPDLYVRIVERRQDGIVVRGAKAHTTAGPVVHELIVIPTRALGPEDRDYAVAFAVPVATPGVKLICRTTGSTQQSAFDYPISRRHIETESLTVFDDVFVPRDRVFLDGEWQFAGPLALTFANFHRFTAISYKPPTGDLFIGAAQLIAEWNGVERAAHIREKIARLIGYTEMIRACTRAAALDPELLPPGIALPSPTMTNIGKHHFASQ
ncbi:MAG: 4-hydroxybutyryl-CoA dehydratase, partial [Deltaproteobacteria bacterium]|nr:4-hydroxybutyryl-CoA dehydratase [Deltaproteobacteria bacterium]